MAAGAAPTVAPAPSMSASEGSNADEAFPPGRKSSAAGGHGYLRVKLEKVDGKFGIAYRAESDGLVITGIVRGSAADLHNHEADADRTLCVGDRILAVNDQQVVPDALTAEEANCKALVAEMMSSSSTSATFRMMQFGPRWHVSGVTSDCLDKMQVYEEQGLSLELVQPDALLLLDDAVVKESEFKPLSMNQMFLIIFMVALPNAVFIALWSDMGLGFALFGALAPSMMNMAGNAIIFGASCVLVGMYLVDWQKWESKVQRVATAVIVIYACCFGGVIKARFYPQAPLVITLFHLPVVIGLLRATALKMVRRSSFYRGIGAGCFVTAIAILGVWLAWMLVEAWDGNNVYNDATKAGLVEKSSVLYQEFKITINDRKRSINYEWDCKAKAANDFDIEYGEPIDNGYKLTVDERKDRSKACSSVKTIWFLLWIAPFITVMTNLVIAAFCAINGSMMEVDDTSKAEKALKQFILMVCVLLLCMWVAASIAGASMRLTGTLMAFCGAALIALFIWMYFEVGAKLIHSTLRTSKIMNTLVTVVTNDWFRACFVIGFNMLIPTMFLIEMLKQKVRRLRKDTDSTSWLTPEAKTALDYLSQWQWAGIFVKVNWLVILYWTLSIGVAKITVVFLAWLNEEFERNISFNWVLVIFFGIGFTMFLLPPVPGIPVYITSGIIIAAQARSIDGVGYGGGIIIATFLSLVLKLAAVCGQYSIGYFLGKSVKIQQLVGVDKVPIRAIERILMTRGLGLGKVAVLVGGPDWPTSVLCGILKLNLLQCCWGTVPVIFVSTPCVLAGAFMASPSADMKEADKSMWDALANTALVVSGAGQLASGVLAIYFTQDVMGKHGDDLAKPRPEHEKVKQLTIAEQDYQNCYTDIMDWKTLPKFWLGLITVATGTMLLSLFIFMFMDEACFRAFQVKDRITDPEGLNCPSGDFGCAVIGIIKDDPPVGWGALFLFFMACFLHAIFLKYASRSSKKLLKAKQASGELETPGALGAPGAYGAPEPTQA